MDKRAESVRNLLVLCLLLLVALFLSHSVLVRMFFTVVLENVLGVPVYIQAATFEPVNTQILLTNVQFENPPGFPRSPLARVPKIFIDLEISSFWERKIHVETLEVDCKEVHILRNAEGEFNWFFLKPFRVRNGEGAPMDIRYETPVFSTMARWPFGVDRYVLSLSSANYIDFKGAVPLKRALGLKVTARAYEQIREVKEIVTIIAWETLIAMETPELQDALLLIAKKIEPKLGTKSDFLNRWRAPAGTAPPALPAEGA